MSLDNNPHADDSMLQCAQTHEELSRFRIAMDMSGDAIYLVDRETMRFLDVNQTACSRMGGRWIIVSIARDITRRKQAEQALHECEQRFRLTFEHAGSGIAHVDLKGRFLKVNLSLCKMLDYPSEELVGRAVKEFSHPEDRDATDTSRNRM